MTGDRADNGLYDATVAVLADGGWSAVTLERVAQHAGRSRVTLWRQGVTRESLLDALFARLAADYREAMWPVLTAGGRAVERLDLAVTALCDVIDAHLPLVLASDTVFHHQPEQSPGTIYLDPFDRVLRDGLKDGSLVVHGRVDDAAYTLMNAVTWTYTHLRGRHHWARRRARRQVTDLVMKGVVAP